ncbi:MAG TPA: DUF29 domain-containing protein [Bryobacteraceae bacterium]|nr:conserved hypothetical protein [Candidatus Sulfopaludibacter sp. SbA4]HYW45951.1 DUF29 domain-containing protein [Bryobacteraceae bacterium]
MKAAELYDTDFSEWSFRNAELLRSGQFDEADLEHIAEEIEDLGKSRRRVLESAVIQILMHLLKYEKQPAKRSRSWLASIAKQRVKIRRVVRESPSLRPQLPEMLTECYPDAVKVASIETGIATAEFPEVCPFTLEMLLDDEFPPT